MGCQQSKAADLDALRPSGSPSSSSPSAAGPPRLSLNQLLLQASAKLEAQDGNASSGPHSSTHRDVFSIFNERGMMLEGQVQAMTSSSSMVMADVERTSSGRRQGSSCSPLSPTGSVFSTATTASETERTLVLHRPAAMDQYVAQLRLSYGACSDKGTRKLNEDREVCATERVHDDVVAFFGLYDGHGGPQVADFLASQLHETVFDRLRNAPKQSALGDSVVDAFAATDEEIFAREVPAGSTAVAVVVRGSCALIASVGDSQAVLSTGGRATDMCVSHTPTLSSERERILRAKGTIAKGRIYGMLGVSRAFGDNDFKTARGEFSKRFNGDLVIATPDVVQHEIAAQDEFLVLGCDGLFEVMEPQHVVDFVRAKLALHGDVQHACEELVSHAINMGSTDNVSAIVVCFHQEPPTLLPAPVQASATATAGSEQVEDPPLSGVTVANELDARVTPAQATETSEEVQAAEPTTRLFPPPPLKIDEAR